MSHGDVVKEIPPGFKIAALSDGGHIAAMESDRVWAVQFHPEVTHTERGLEILKNFAEKLCKAKADWDAPHMLTYLKQEILNKVGDKAHVLCGLSGGVDSTVVAILLTQVLGRERVHCVFVDNGLLRKYEYETVMKNYENLGLNIKGSGSAQHFLSELKGVTDPEKKRKTIGRVFIEVFEKATHDLPHVDFLAQGTLYPDVIESVSSVGGSVTIKSHHNVGGLPEKMRLKLVEPIRELYKDEVRKLGAELGIPRDLLWRHPFPGPGLAIRIIGEVNERNLTILRDADDIYTSYLKEKNLYDKIWQAFCVLLPVSSVGVQGDSRTYDQVLALRAVTSSDGMTADWYPFQFEDLREISNRITNKVKGINRVVYDVTSKPPATIEWE
jgi:GMP synthase (glutamine-hydrolysing)